MGRSVCLGVCVFGGVCVRVSAQVREQSYFLNYPRLTR